MTRTRADDYDDKRQAIADHAAKLIAAKGFERATMIEVARACGASKSHLYHYFPSKEDLLYAILHDHAAALVRDLGAIARAAGPAQVRFSNFVGGFVERAAQYRDVHIVLMRDLRFLRVGQLERILELENELTEFMVDLLRDINPGLMASKRVRKPYALMLFGMMIWTLSWYRKDGDIPPTELADRMSALFVGGFEAAVGPAEAPAAAEAQATERP